MQQSEDRRGNTSFDHTSPQITPNIPAFPLLYISHVSYFSTNTFPEILEERSPTAPQVLDLLWKENFIRGYIKTNDGLIKVLLRYYDGLPMCNRLTPPPKKQTTNFCRAIANASVSFRNPQTRPPPKKKTNENRTKHTNLKLPR